MTATVAAFTHPTAVEHDAGPGHPERPERLDAIRRHLSGCGVSERLRWLDAEPAEPGWIRAVHEASYVERLEALDAEGGGRLDPDTRMGHASLEAASRGAGAAVAAVKGVADGDMDGAFVFMRPPGHHATADRAMGFCLFNHVAVAARWAVTSDRAERVFICDWDAHHGNGTQDIFWEDPHVFYASLHQYPWYPGTGELSDSGDGPGRGTTLNVPLPAGAAEDAYTRAFDEVVLPAARAFEPDLVLVSAGYDAHARDPLCMMRLTAGAFFRFSESLLGLGRGLVCVLEGGYDLDGLSWSVAATLSAMLGDDEPAGVPEPEAGSLDGDQAALRWVDRAAEQRGG